MNARRLIALVAIVLCIGTAVWGLVPFGSSEGHDCNGALTYLVSGRKEFPAAAGTSVTSMVEWGDANPREQSEIRKSQACYDDGRPRAVTTLIVFGGIVVAAIAAVLVVGGPSGPRRRVA